VGYVEGVIEVRVNGRGMEVFMQCDSGEQGGGGPRGGWEGEYILYRIGIYQHGMGVRSRREGRSICSIGKAGEAGVPGGKSVFGFEGVEG